MYDNDLYYGLFLSDRQLDFLSNYPQGFDRMKCFATFLHLAVKEPTHYEKKEYSVDLTPGQFAVSEVALAKLWKCNRKTASKIVDMFHEVGLVSSVPNCRTTVFTVHCVASWYIGNEVVRNTHYSRHPQVEQRIKANHKRTDAVSGNEVNDEPSNKGMSTPLSIPNLSAVTILMRVTAGKRNYSMMVSNRQPRLKKTFPHPSPLLMQPLAATDRRTKRSLPLDCPTRIIRMLPPRHQPKRFPTMPCNSIKGLGQPEGSLNFRTL